MPLANDVAEVSFAKASAHAIDTFKGFFPSGKVPRGKSLLLSRRASDGALFVQYEVRLRDDDPMTWLLYMLVSTGQDRVLGTLSDKFLSRELMLAYFADNGKEISPKVGHEKVIGSAPDVINSDEGGCHRWPATAVKSLMIPLYTAT